MKTKVKISIVTYTSAEADSPVYDVVFWIKKPEEKYYDTATLANDAPNFFSTADINILSDEIYTRCLELCSTYGHKTQFKVISK